MSPDDTGTVDARFNCIVATEAWTDENGQNRDFTYWPCRQEGETYQNYKILNTKSRRQF